MIDLGHHALDPARETEMEIEVARGVQQVREMVRISPLCLLLLAVVWIPCS